MEAVEEAKGGIKALLGTDEDTTLDKSGRFLLSKKKRERLGDDFAMAIGELGCICLYPESRWQERLAEINRTDPMNPGRQEYARLFFGTSDDELSCDSQGRVVIPSHIRDVVTVKDKVHVIGCFDHIEVWDPQEYREYKKYGDKYGESRRLALSNSYSKMKGVAVPASS